jgi:hypothetical protein
MPLGSTAPICLNPPAPGRAFCAFHAAQLDALREDAKGWTAQAVVPAAPVTVRQIEPKPSGPPKLPREYRAVLLAKAVHAAGHLTRDQAAAAAGVKPGALPRIARYATEQGWIKSRRGGRGGGYEAGPVRPSEDALAA